VGNYIQSMKRYGGVGANAFASLPEFEQKLILAAVEAPDESWVKFTSRGGASITDEIAPWGDFLPIFPGKDPSSLGAKSEKIWLYNKFFENYLLAGDPGRTSSAPPAKWLSNKVPSREYVKKYASLHDKIDETTALNHWQALHDAHIPEPFDKQGSPFIEDFQKLRPWLRELYGLFGYLSGIPAKSLPRIQAYKSPTLNMNMAFSPWHDHRVTPQLEDFGDLLLYMYLTIPNSRFDNQVRLKELTDAAKLDEFVNAKPEDQKTAAGALEVRAAQKLRKKLFAGEKMTSGDMALLRTLANGDDDILKSKIREADQCILRLNLETFNDGYYEKNSTQTMGGRGSSLVHRRHRPHESIYQDSMSPSTIMNKLAYCPNAGPLLEARTHEISQLMPMVRLFKTYYNNETNDIDEEVEFYFEGGISDDQILEGRTGVGIKSFEWELNATNPSTVRNDITATLTLYFQGFKELSRERTGKDVLTGKPRKFQFQDLLLRPTREGAHEAPKPSETGCNKDNSIYDSRFYEVKALVGWSPPKTLEAVEYEKYQKDSKNKGLYSPLVKALKSQQIPLFLTLIDHEFSITQEGTFELKISYRARMEAINSDPRLDVLTSPTRKEAIDILQEEIKAARTECADEEEIKTLEDEVGMHRELDRDRLSSSILDGLEPFIYLTELKTDSIHKALLGVEDATSTNSALIDDLAIDWSDLQKSFNRADKNKKQEVMAQLKKNLVDSSGSGTRKQREEAEKAVKNGEKVNDLNYASLNGETTIIPWFYFGDLVDIVVKNALENNKPGSQSAPVVIAGVELKNLVYLMGTYDYISIGSFKNTVAANIKRRVGQLSAVPVPVAAYNSWFVRNVVNSERSSFPLMEFLRSFIQQVIAPFLNRKCFDTPAFKQLWTKRGVAVHNSRWIEISPLISKTAAISVSQGPAGENPLEKFRTFPAASVNDFLRSCEVNLGNFEIPGKDSGPDNDGKMLAKRKESYQQTIKNSYHISVFYLISQDSYKDFGPPTDPFKDRETRDQEIGVHHLYLGADVGLVKEVTFSKVDAPYLREARIQQDSLNPLAQLAATYNVNLKMVGNTIFWPGQYIFVNPVGFGTGLPTERGSISNQLGLGGYHLLTEVKSFIEDGKYETNIKGLYEFSGDGCPSLPQSTPVEPCEPTTDNSHVVSEQDGPEVPG
jgi:hypothetical protein